MSQTHVLVTGAAGFIGSRFVKACHEQGLSTISVDKPNYFKTRSELSDVQHPKIVDRKQLFQWLKKHKPNLSAIVHLGACTDTAELDRAYLTKINLKYSKDMWQYATEHRIPLVYASSAATYGDGSEGYDDDEKLIPKLKPLNPYGESKLQFDIWALEQESQNLCPPSWVGFKFFNVYGFGERHKRKMTSVVVHAYDQIKDKGRVRLFKSHKPGIADGHQKRDFIYVEDVVDVLRFALTKPIKRGIFNLGTGKAQTFLDLVRPVFTTLGVPENIEFIDTPEVIRERYQYFTQATMERLRKEGYTKPFTSLKDGVAKYVNQLEK